MKIGIIGSGAVGLTLATACIKAGHQVMVGTRDIQKKEITKWLEENPKSKGAGSFLETATFGEVIFLCTNWGGTKNALDLSGQAALKNKVVIDVTNPLDNQGPDSEGRLSFLVGHSASGGEMVQSWLPDSRVVKALNSIGYFHMDHPVFAEGEPTMFIAGNEAEAKKIAEQLLHQLGWNDVVDLGPIKISREIEPLCILWCAYGFRTGTWKHAFKLLKN